MIDFNDPRCFNALSEYFWSVCNADDNEIEIWREHGMLRLDLIPDSQVRGLIWLSEYLYVWLLTGGISACEGSYDGCVRMFEHSKRTYNNGSSLFRRPKFWQEPKTERDEPILTRERFEQMRNATTNECECLLDSFHTAARTSSPSW